MLGLLVAAGFFCTGLGLLCAMWLLYNLENRVKALEGETHD